MADEGKGWLVVALACSFPRTRDEVDEMAARCLREVKERLFRFGARCEVEAAARKVNLREARMSDLLPVLEAARHVDDDQIQQMFARLLVASVEAKGRARPIFVQWLSAMSPEDAHAFRDVCARAERIGLKGPIDGESRPAYDTNVPQGLSEAMLEALNLIEWYHHDGAFITVPSPLGWQFRAAVLP
jgi:ferritin